MKRIFTVGVALAALFFASCEPNEDIYDKLDDQKKPYRENISYALVPTDYSTASAAAKIDALDKADSTKADLIKTQMAFNPRFTADDYVDAVLAKNFPALKLGSTAVVTYNEVTEEIDYLTAIAGATKYTLSSDDYVSVGGSVASMGFFTPSSTAKENVPAILSSAIASPLANQLALVTYKQSDIEPSTEIVVDLFNENFESYLNKDTIKNDGWLNYIEQHTWWWLARVYNSNAYAQMGANSAPGPVVAWLVSPEIDLSTSTENTFSFDINVGYYNASCLSVFIMQNVDPSDIGAATKTDVTSNFTIPTTPTSGYGTFVTAGTMDLSAYSGKIRIGFKYSGDGVNSQTTTYQVDNVVVKGMKASKKSAKAELFKTYNDFYVYSNSTWIPSSSYIAVQPHEYDEMGVPGKFSEEKPSGKYIPTLLSMKFPYAQEGDNIIVAYNYYDGKTTTLTADAYIYQAGSWMSVSVGNIVTKTAQFIHAGKKWVFDPTVNLTLDAADYQLMVDYVKENVNSAYVDKYGTAEYYYGFSAYYKNISLRLSSRVPYASVDIELSALETEQEKIDLLTQRLINGMEIFAQLRYPNAVPTVNGVDVYYNLTASIYYPKGVEAGTEVRTYKFKCTGASSNGNPPTFEFIP